MTAHLQGSHLNSQPVVWPVEARRVNNACSIRDDLQVYAMQFTHLNRPYPHGVRRLPYNKANDATRITSA